MLPLVVQPAFRDRAINGQIIETLKSCCVDQGVSELRLQVYSGNVEAIGARDRAGFTLRMVEMRLQLPMRQLACSRSSSAAEAFGRAHRSPRARNPALTGHP